MFGLQVLCTFVLLLNEVRRASCFRACAGLSVELAARTEPKRDVLALNLVESRDGLRQHLRSSYLYDFSQLLAILAHRFSVSFCVNRFLFIRKGVERVIVEVLIEASHCFCVIGVSAFAAIYGKAIGYRLDLDSVLGLELLEERGACFLRQSIYIINCNGCLFNDRPVECLYNFLASFFNLLILVSAALFFESLENSVKCLLVLLVSLKAG